MTIHVTKVAEKYSIHYTNTRGKNACQERLVELVKKLNDCVNENQ